MAKVAVLVPYLEMREIARPMLEGYDHIQAMCVEYAHHRYHRRTGPHPGGPGV